MRAQHIPSVYWPGLRIGDGYSLTVLDTTTTPWTLTLNSKSGLDRVQWAWGQD